ncbi:MAG: tRNA (adenosine(37)-N6)-threonylcarbamoyltransferase complex ATPase subunit type 1 TsaE [Muribaculaceae bacterium]|nr:tRNA (adenosine(37)-N6)-threonylcarbamoyltransferase complex ATPase subunit type 1 TsaE [Muribaculaceae bacterium]
MSKQIFDVAGLADVQSVAVELARLLKADAPRIVAFEGEMGAGKTTLIRSLVRALGADGSDGANSPSFAIANDYGLTPDGMNVLHFDLYRLESEAEAMDIGFEDYLDDPDNICLVEWPDRAGELMPDELTLVRIELLPDHTRKVEIEY